MLTDSQNQATFISECPTVIKIDTARGVHKLADGVNHSIIIRHLKQRGKRKLDQRVKLEEKKLAESFFNERSMSDENKNAFKKLQEMDTQLSRENGCLAIPDI
ncbi:hypothetical protein Tco_0040325 [Tanacetum coccineum]